MNSTDRQTAGRSGGRGRRWRVRPAATAVLAVALLAGVAVPAPARAQPVEPTVVDEVGFMQSREVDGEVRVGVLSRDYDGGDEQWVPAEEAVVHVPESSSATVPVDTEPFDPEFGPFYRFMGEEGDPVYLLPVGVGSPAQYEIDVAAAQARGVPVLGFASHPSVRDGTRIESTLFRGVDGPGEAFVYDDYQSGSRKVRNVYLDLDRVDGRQNSVLNPPSPRLKSWAFTQAGVYCIDMVTSTRPLGSADETLHVPAALTVVVGDTDPASVTPCAQPDPDEDPEPVDPDAPVVFGAGAHIDVAARVGEDSPLELGIRKSDAAGGGNVSWHELDDTVISVPDAARRTVPADERFRFLGEPGSSRWNIPVFASENRAAPWLGLGGEEIDAVLLPGVALRMTGVAAPDAGTAPGDMVVWDADATGGGSAVFSTRQGLPMGTNIPDGSHRHANWDFSAPGVYCVGFDMDARRPSGEWLRDEGILTFVVGDAVDPREVVPCGRAGDEVPEGTHTAVRETAPAGVPVELSMAPFAALGTPNGFAHLSTGLDADGGLDVRLVRGAPGGPGVSHDPDDVVFRMDRQDPDGVRAGRPDLGAPGDPLWRITQGGFGVGLFIDAYGVEPEQVRGDIAWELTGVEGPGEFSLGGANLGVFNTRAGFELDSHPFRPGRLDRSDWAFSAPGVYCVDMAWSATLASGAVVSDAHTLTFVAGDTPAEVVPCAQGQQPTPPDDDDGDPTDPVDPPDPVVPPSGREVLDIGHVDLFGRPADGAVEVSVKDSRVDPSAPVFREVADTVFHVPPWARQEVPLEGYEFLGAPGSDLWVLPQTQDEELLWPGWDGILSGAVTGYRLTLDDATGPGAVVLYTDGVLGGGEPLLGSRAGLPSSFDFDVHGHGNWAFTAPGVYCLDVTMSALPASAGLASDSETLLVTVGGDVDPVSATPADCDASGPVDPPPGGGDPDPVTPPGAGTPDPSGPDGPGTPGGPDGSSDPDRPARPGGTDPDAPGGPDGPGDGADPDVPDDGVPPPVGSAVERIAGQNRIDTAVALSRSSFESADTVVVTTAADFPDALTAGPLAGTAEAPVLLTWPDRLDGGVAAEIARLGASQVVVVGGEVAVEPSVAADLAQLASLTRLGGTTRYGTAVAVAEHLGGVGATGGRVVLATGGDFPDALAGGVLAGRSDAPVLLTGTDGLPAETAAELGRRSPEEVLVLGGDVAVRDAVLPEVETAAGAEPRRIAGDTRYATAAAVAAELGDAEVAYVSTGAGFADALAAVPVATVQDGVLLLVGADAVPDETMAALDRLAPSRTVVLGGEAAVGPDVLAALDG